MSNLIDTRITAALELELQDLNSVPACRNMAVAWLGQMAISFSVGSFIDDFMFKANGQEMRDSKRNILTQLLSFCMDYGYTPQQAHDEIATSIEKVAETDFKAKSFSQEQLELLIACGEEESTLLKTMAEENGKAAGIHNRRKNKLVDFIGDIRGQMEHILANARGVDSPDFSGAPAWLIKLIATKVLGAEEQHRKYLIRGITQGHLNNAGQLTILNHVMKSNRMSAIHDRLEEMERESQFDDSGVIERGRIGDDENVDITY